MTFVAFDFECADGKMTKLAHINNADIIENMSDGDINGYIGLTSYIPECTFDNGIVAELFAIFVNPLVAQAAPLAYSAICAHEIGHAYHRHYTSVPADREGHAPFLGTDISLEVEADQFAIRTLQYIDNPEMYFSLIEGAIRSLVIDKHYMTTAIDGLNERKAKVMELL